MNSCYNWEYLGDDSGSSKDIADLVVNDEFDWKTSSNIQFIITGTESGTLKITSSNGEVVFHKGYYTGLT